MHQTLAHRVCAFLQLDPPTLPASADELELAAAAALLAAFWQARTSCELLSCVVFDAAGVAETLLRTTWPRDDAEACVMPVLHDDAACAAGDAMLIIAVFTDDAARTAGEAMSSVAVSPRRCCLRRWHATALGWCRCADRSLAFCSWGVITAGRPPCASHRCPAMTQRHLVPLALHI